MGYKYFYFIKPLSRGESDIAVFYPPLDRGYAKIRYGISNCGVEQASVGSPPMPAGVPRSAKVTIWNQNSKTLEMRCNIMYNIFKTILKYTY